MWLVKACVSYFQSNFYFSPNDSPSKTLKNFLFYLKSSFCSQDIQIFVILFSPLFSPVSHYFRGWSEKNKVYKVINCLNKNLITYFVCYLEKEKSCDIETLSIDREWNKEHFTKNHAKNVHQKLAPDPILILLSNPKQPLDARNSFKNKIKSLKKVNFIFTFESSPF